MSLKKSGFSLIELMVAIVIFAIMFVGLLQAVVFGLHLNILNSKRITARTYLNNFTNQLRTLPRDHLFLLNDGDNTDLNDIVNPDHQDTVIYQDMYFDVMWNIAEDPLDSTLTHIKVFVFWDQRRYRVSAHTLYFKQE
jgi:prepilin-type N-terminal cleavage/methylation domain-containing protein